MWRAGLLAILFLLACDRPRTSAPVFALRGPLVPLVARMPTGLAACRRELIEYAQPFWRAPYQVCGTDAEGVEETLELDSDSVAVSLYSRWRVTRAMRDAEFARVEKATAQVLGPGRWCSPRKVEWRGSDTLHAILQLTPEGDVGDLEESPTWKITRLARLGPLDPATWGCGSAAPAI